MSNSPHHSTDNRPTFRTQYSYTGRAYRGNLHGHTTSSDGVLDAEAVVRMYKGLRYDFTAITDHNHWEDRSHLSDSDFIVLNGVEISPASNRRHHVLSIGTDVDPGPADDIPAAIRKTTELGGIPVVCHPMWSGIHTDLLTALPAFPVLEILNHGLWGGVGQDESSIWDELLIRNRPIWGISSDDSHVPGHFGKGWIDLWADDFTVSGLKGAILRGSFYASTGPTITEVQVTEREYRLVAPDSMVVAFIADTGLVKKGIGNFRETVMECVYTLPEKDPPRYVRAIARTVDSKQAFTPPVFVDPRRYCRV